MSITRDSLVAAFRAKGLQLWVVGGVLRDEFLGRPNADEDFATDALPDDVEELAQSLGADVVTVGKRFGTIGVLVSGRWTEITTFRGDSYESGTRWPEVRFGTSIEEDVARRDFTANALARNAHTGELLDLYHGREDIEARVLRAVGEPATRFREDPLRILRGIRFVGQLGFTIEPTTLEGMRATAELTATLSVERVTAEMDKLLVSGAPSAGLELLRESDVLGVLFPELQVMVGCEQNRFHKYDVWEHTVATVASVATDRNARLRRWAALLHDVGKPPVRHPKKNGEWGFFAHETAGADVAASMLQRLKVSRQLEHEVTALVRRHMDRPNLEERRSVRRFMARSGDRWPDLLALKRADNASHTYDDSAYHDRLLELCETIAREDAEALKAESPLDGDELVALFDRAPGPWIRRIKLELSNRVRDGDLSPGDKAGAEVVARALMRGERPV